MAYFQNAAAGYYQTPNASRGENPGAEAGWTLGGPYGSRFVHPVGFGGDRLEPRQRGRSSGSRSTSTAGRTRCRPPRTRLPRRPAPCWSAPWVSRRPQPANLSARESTWKLAYAASFTNGNDAVHTLHGVQIEVTVIPPSPGPRGNQGLHLLRRRRETGVALHELGLRANPQVGVLTFDAPADTTLAANTTFWLVIDIAHSPTEDFFRTAVTSSTGQDACAIRNWSIGDVAYFREGPGAAWSPNADLLKMAILGEPGDQRVGRVGRAHLRRPARRHHHHRAPRRRR